jgi:CheY-like chemotaxis protein
VRCRTLPHRPRFELAGQREHLGRHDGQAAGAQDRRRGVQNGKARDDGIAGNRGRGRGWRDAGRCDAGRWCDRGDGLDFADKAGLVQGDDDALTRGGQHDVAGETAREILAPRESRVVANVVKWPENGEIITEQQDSLGAEPSPPPRSVLVVVVDPQLRQMVSWLLDDLGFAHVDVPSWRRAVTTTDARPALVICDLDDVGANVAWFRAILRSGWGEAVPFIGLSYRADVDASAVESGAVAGLRKPLNAGLLMTTVERLVGGGGDPPTLRPG